MKITIAACVLAALVGVGVGVAEAGTGSGVPVDAPAGKAAAVAGATVVDPSTLDLGAGVSYATPVADSGAPATIAALKVRVPELLAADTAMGRMPDLPASQRKAALAASMNRGAVISQLHTVWAPGVIDDQVKQWIAADTRFSGDPTYASYTDNTFAVDQWQGVTVSGDEADVLLLGYDRYLMADGWKSDRERQWQVHLVQRGDGTWLLDTVVSVDLPLTSTSSDQTGAVQ